MCNVYICISFHCHPTNLANPFVIAHPDLPPDAALGQSFEMMFVVGFNSNGKMNDLSPLGTATSQITLSLNSTVVNTAEFSSDLPYTLQYQVPISTVSEGNYTLAVGESVQLCYAFTAHS